MTRYELLERIGVGGMAEVFRGRATAVGGFEKPVAIKKILPHLSQDNRFVALLIAEAKLLANLRQRNIVQIFDVGLGEDGGYFLVMEYVDGHDLGALFERMEQKRERFPLDLALHIGSEVCEALEHAHKAMDSDGKPLTLVHRDVTPSNIMLSNSGEVKLTDFGIAKKVDSNSAVQSIAGKFAYMSPEQASGKPVGPGSDIFSLAVVLWEILLGRRLHPGLPEMEVLKLVREARVQRPREIDPTFSRELESILMKAMSADPRQRYANASLFGAALRDYRYSAATAGDPTREIQALLKRYFGALTKGQPREQSKILRIETVAGFDPLVPEAPAKPAAARRIFDNFDAPTVAADGLSQADGPAQLPGVSASAGQGQGQGQGQGKNKAKGGAGGGNGEAPMTLLPSFDMADDAETRMIDTRRPRRTPDSAPPPSGERAATPTIKDLPPSVLIDPLAAGPHQSQGPGRLKAPAAPVAPPVRVSQPRVPSSVARADRRRTYIVGVLAVAVLVLTVLVIGRYTRSAPPAPPTEPAAPAALPGASGDALEGPAIKAPVKKEKRQK